MKNFFAALRAHIGNNQDFYVWPLVLLVLCVAATEIVFAATGRKPLADLAVNLQALQGYGIESVPVFLSLLWASLAGRFLAWTFKTHEEWAAAPWVKQLLDLLVPLVVFIVCMHHFDLHS